MHRSLIEALVVLTACAAAVSVQAQPAPAPAVAATAPGPAWKQIFENGQLVYYVDAAGFQRTGRSSLSSLLQYKVPQVINGAQVWSMVTHMQLSCDQDQMLTVDNTLYALKMGAGPVVESQPANDTWHTPQPGSLGGLVWNSVCGTR